MGSGGATGTAGVGELELLPSQCICNPIFKCNVTNRTLSPSTHRIRSAFGGKRVRRPTHCAARTAEDLEAYAGDYESEEIDMIYRMRFENGRLMLSRSK
jgi:hypothetical protein